MTRISLILSLLLALTSPARADWLEIRHSGLEDAVIATDVIDHQLVIQASPEKVFRVLTDSDWKQWFVDFESVEWTSPRPFGVGSTRTVKTRMLAVKERFLAWDPGRRFSFSIDAIDMPLLTAMMEDMQLEPLDNGKATRFRWRIYYTPAPLMAAVHPIARAIFGGMFRQSLENLKAYAEKQPD